LSPGEHLTIWGYQPGVSRFVWVANDGADGYKGATMHSDLDGNGVILRFNRSSQHQDEPSAAPGQTSRRAFATQASSVAWH